MYDKLLVCNIREDSTNPSYHLPIYSSISEDFAASSNDNNNSVINPTCNNVTNINWSAVTCDDIANYQILLDEMLEVLVLKTDIYITVETYVVLTEIILLT